MAINQPPYQNSLNRGGKEIVNDIWHKWFLSIYESQFKNIVVVKSKFQLQGNLSSSVLYLLDGVIDMGSTSITVPEGGLSIAGLNGARDISKLVSSEDNYTLFVTDTYSGNVVMESLSIEVTGTGSQVFNLDNAENSSALDIVNVNFNNCTSLGELTDYRQLFMTTCGFIFIGDGLTFNGTWSGGLAITDSIAIGFPASTTLFKEGTSLLFEGSVRSNINFLSVASSSVLFDFQESNIDRDAGFSLDNVRTTADDAVPNISGSSVKARFRECSGIRDTYVGAEWKLTTETATSIPSAGTPYKIAGTTTYSDEQWFSHTTNNSMIYDSSEMIEVKINAVFSFTGTNGDQISVYLYKYDSSSSTYVEISESGKFTLNSGGRAENMSVAGITTLDTNDRIECWVENYSGARSVTLLENSLCIVEER